MSDGKTVVSPPRAPALPGEATRRRRRSARCRLRETRGESPMARLWAVLVELL